MKVTAVAAMLILTRMASSAQEAGSIQEALSDPRVIAAVRIAWQQTTNGTSGKEAAFRLDGSPSEYEVIAVPCSREHMRQKVVVIPGKTFAVFHVHPDMAEPYPSLNDRTVADRLQLNILTIHRRGLYDYDPGTKRTTKLRTGLAWLAKR